MIASEIFGTFPGVTAFLSERSDGSMRSWPDPEADQATAANRATLLNRHSIHPGDLVRAGLVHGRTVRAVGQTDRGRLVAAADGLMTNEPGVFLGVTVADCLPVFFVDPAGRAVGLAHAGWRGLAADILRATVEQMGESYATNPEDLRVFVGPGIGPCHYEVGQDVVKAFPTHPGAVAHRDGTTWLDLKLIADEQLRELGLASGRVTVSPDCTACLNEKYFSYRRDKPAELEAMLAVIGLA